MLPTPNAWLGRRPENAMADPERAASRDHEGTRGKRSIELPDAIAAEVRLLPTPQAADGSRGAEQGVRFYAGGGDNPTLLGAARRVTGESRPHGARLLPTPQASDGTGGRQEKSAMRNHGKRPSGQKATLTLGTAVELSGELTSQPFAAGSSSSDGPHPDQLTIEDA